MIFSINKMSTFLSSFVYSFPLDMEAAILFVLSFMRDMRGML